MYDLSTDLNSFDFFFTSNINFLLCSICVVISDSILTELEQGKQILTPNVISRKPFLLNEEVNSCRNLKSLKVCKNWNILIV